LPLGRARGPRRPLMRLNLLCRAVISITWPVSSPLAGRRPRFVHFDTCEAKAGDRQTARRTVSDRIGPEGPICHAAPVTLKHLRCPINERTLTRSRRTGITTKRVVLEGCDRIGTREKVQMTGTACGRLHPSLNRSTLSRCNFACRASRLTSISQTHSLRSYMLRLV
jgi:hypothetical protein